MQRSPCCAFASPPKPVRHCVLHAHDAESCSAHLGEGSVQAQRCKGRSLKPVTYQLRIVLERPMRLAIGQLGVFDFPAGRYVYTGSARRNLEARIARHRRKRKALHWHIDWLLAARGVRIVSVRRSHEPECMLNSSVPGRILAAGFGASDCRNGCVSHLHYLGR